MTKQPGILLDDNPYRASNEAVESIASSRTYAGRAGTGRFLAANIDAMFSVVIFLAIGMNLAEPLGNTGAGLAALASYLGYFFFPEWLLGTTAGKSLFGLRVRQIDGAPCTAGQIAVRTLMRLVEVNPVLLGVLPAGISILLTKRRQRLGDLLAKTVVVHHYDDPR